jgi:hypothetical protein
MNAPHHTLRPTPTHLLAQGSHTHLAEALNAAMAADSAARAAYAAIYGEDWAPLHLAGNGTQPPLTAATLARSVLVTAR